MVTDKRNSGVDGIQLFGVIYLTNFSVLFDAHREYVIHSFRSPVRVLNSY
jgi:hypothetical protein